MLINFSNHPIADWTPEQIDSANQLFGGVKDLIFPEINPEYSADELTLLAQKYVKQIIEDKPAAVHIMGELNFTFICVNLLKTYGVKCVASTTKRVSSMHHQIKTATFTFVQFREY